MIRQLCAAPIVVGSTTLTVVFRLELASGACGPGCWLRASLAPQRVLIRNAEGLHALDLQGQPVSLDELDAARS